MQIDVDLTEPQEDFVFSPAEFPLIVAGFGAGKSEALIKRSILQKLQYPDLDQGYFAPTFDLIRLIAWDRYQNILNEKTVDPFYKNAVVIHACVFHYAPNFQHNGAQFHSQ